MMFSISFVVVVVRSRLIGFDRSHRGGGAPTSGATPLQTFRHVTLPLLAPGVMAAGLLAFALSIDDFVISNFNSGTTVTFPLYVYGVALRGIPIQVNVLATMLFLARRGRDRARDLAAAARGADGGGRRGRAGARADASARRRSHADPLRARYPPRRRCDTHAE